MGNRLQEMAALVEQRGFLSVKELSQEFAVSEVTIRRDLQRLHDEHRLLRTFGGAAPLVQPVRSESTNGSAPAMGAVNGSLALDQVDVCVNVSLSPRADTMLLERADKHCVAIIAESLAMQGARTLVTVDNFQAGWSLGYWTGTYAQQHLAGSARVLDLTYHLSNTQDRSRGFVAGLLDVQPTANVVLSLATQSDRQSAYRLTSDALHVHPDINVIFCINDILACGAIQACQDMGIDPDAVLVVTFGLEGDTLKDELLERTYLKAGLAMFPEIVGPVCVEAAIGAYKGIDLPPQLVTPHAVLTADTLGDFYVPQGGTWHLNLAAAVAALPIPLAFTAFGGGSLPQRIGFLVPFGEHEWYRSLIAAMRTYAGNLGIGVMLADVTENLKEELSLRKLSIAQTAGSLVKPGDVILIDSGQVTTYLAQALRGMSGITVITNGLGVFDALRDRPGINLLVTGGVLRHESQALIGPTVESILRELRADKLFLSVSGVSIGFGLSHTNPAEVAIKQAMIRAAREIILLADHTKFEQESVMQIAPLPVVNKLVTDDALPASTRLELAKLGIEVILAKN
jgi:DeoR/GlpR family transcriptional regulator of sugar metabolism